MFYVLRTHVLRKDFKMNNFASKWSNAIISFNMKAEPVKPYVKAILKQIVEESCLKNGRQGLDRFDISDVDLYRIVSNRATRLISPLHIHIFRNSNSYRGIYLEYCDISKYTFLDKISPKDYGENVEVKKNVVKSDNIFYSFLKNLHYTEEDIRKANRFAETFDQIRENLFDDRYDPSKEKLDNIFNEIAKELGIRYTKNLVENTDADGNYTNYYEFHFFCR